MNLFELFATLNLDTGNFETGISNASSKAQDAAGKLESIGDNAKSSEGKLSTFGTKIKGAMQVAGTAITAVTAGATALTGALVKGASDVAKYGDSIDKNSQKLGMSTDAYQEWDYVLNLAGSSMEEASTGIKTLTNKLDEAKNGSETAIEMFASLGFSLDDLNAMSQEELFTQTILSLQNMEAGTERAALANDLLGRSGQALTPLLNMTNEETQKAIETTHEYGMIMSEDAVKASAQYQDSLTTMKNSLGGVKNAMLGEFLPSLTTVMDGFTAFINGDQNGLQAVNRGLSNFMNSIVDHAPELIDGVIEIISQLLQCLIDNAPKLAEAGVKLFVSLITKLPQIITQIVKALPQIIRSIVQGFKDALPQLAQAGLDLMGGLVQGIASSITAVVAKVKEVASNILGAVKGFFGIASPSKVFKGVGGFLMEGLAIGIDDGSEYAFDSINSAVDGVMKSAESLNGKLTDAFTSNFTATMNADDWNVDTNNPSNIIVQVYASEGQDEEEIAEIVSARIADQYGREGAVFA